MYIKNHFVLGMLKKLTNPSLSNLVLYADDLFYNL